MRTLRLAASEPDALAFSPDGRWLAVGFCNGKAIQVWTADGSRKVFTLEGHSAPVHCLTFHRDSRLLASGGVDGTVRLWDMDTGKLAKILVSPMAPRREPRIYRALTFHPDGKQLAAGDTDGFVTLWDLDSGALAYRFLAGVGHVDHLAYHPNGRWLGCSGGIAEARLWDVEARKLLRAFVGHQHQVSCIAFSADGRTTATASEDETIGIWDTNNGRRLKTLKGHNAWAFWVCFVPRKDLGGAAAGLLLG